MFTTGIYPRIGARFQTSLLTLDSRSEEPRIDNVFLMRWPGDRQGWVPGRLSLGNERIFSNQGKGDTNMSSQVLGLRVASVVFGLISLAQLWRVVIQPEVLVAGHQMPLWPSVLALVIFAGLSIWLWKLSRIAPR